MKEQDRSMRTLRSNAVAPEESEKAKRKQFNENTKRLVFDGVYIPKKPGLIPGKLVETTNGNQKTVRFEAPKSIDRPLKKPSVTIEDVDEPDDEDTIKLIPSSRPTNQINSEHRPYDHVQPRTYRPIQINTPTNVPRDQTNQIDSHGYTPAYRVRNEVSRPGVEEDMAKKIFDAKVDLSTEELAALSPAIRKIIMRKIRNRRVRPRTKTNNYVSTLSEDGETEILDDPSRVQMIDTCIRIEDLWQDQADMFEVLAESRNDIPVGSIVQKDIVESFLRDPSIDDERRNIAIVANQSVAYEDHSDHPVVVANQSNGLRAVTPEINNKDEEIESVLDQGSQIVVIDRLIAIGLGITWDPEFTIRMQDASGKLNQTLGLARNIPFKFGEVTVYLQLHVQNKAPFQVLLGRPFDVLVESEIKTFGNGDSEITISDPNSHKRVTVGTYPRGQKGRNIQINTSRYNEPKNVTPDNEKSTGENDSKGNFHSSMS